MAEELHNTSFLGSGRNGALSNVCAEVLYPQVNLTLKP